MSENYRGILPVDISLYKKEVSGQPDDIYILTSIDIASGIGILKEDEFFVEVETIAYFTTRVALLDILVTGGRPVSIAFSTSLSNNYYENVKTGILKALNEWSIEIEDQITGSTEDNFKSKQTSVSIMATGLSTGDRLNWLQVNKGDNLFIVGKPVVGAEVLRNSDKIINPETFQNLLEDKSTKNLIPIGSGGALMRIKAIIEKTGLEYKPFNDQLENKSAGPATAILLVSNREIDYYQNELKIPITQLGKLI